MSITDGWSDQCDRSPSPNFGSRPAQAKISLLVIHNISLPPDQYGTGYVQKFFQNELPVDDHPYFQSIEDLRVSAHFFIDRQGLITQFVSCEERAWHAGESSFNGVKNCNDYSIGVELEGSDHIPYEDAQYESLVRLTREILLSYPDINAQRIVGHSDIAPVRKSDPGPAFDWERYQRRLELAKTQ